MLKPLGATGKALALLLAPALLMASPGRAETEAEFFKGKQIRMVVGFPAGNEYDLGARLLARHADGPRFDRFAVGAGGHDGPAHRRIPAE